MLGIVLCEIWLHHIPVLQQFYNSLDNNRTNTRERHSRRSRYIEPTFSFILFLYLFIFTRFSPLYIRYCNMSNIRMIFVFLSIFRVCALLQTYIASRCCSYSIIFILYCRRCSTSSRVSEYISIYFGTVILKKRIQQLGHLVWLTVIFPVMRVHIDTFLQFVYVIVVAIPTKRIYL